MELKEVAIAAGGRMYETGFAKHLAEIRKHDMVVHVKHGLLPTSFPLGSRGHEEMINIIEQSEKFDDIGDSLRNLILMPPHVTMCHRVLVDYEIFAAVEVLGDMDFYANGMFYDVMQPAHADFLSHVRQQMAHDWQTRHPGQHPLGPREVHEYYTSMYPSGLWNQSWFKITAVTVLNTPAVILKPEQAFGEIESLKTRCFAINDEHPARPSEGENYHTLCIQRLKDAASMAFLGQGGRRDFTIEDIIAYYQDRYPAPSIIVGATPEKKATDAVNPSHHKNFNTKGQQWLEAYCAGMSPEDTRRVAQIHGDKYFDRIGRKDKPLQEAEKGLWYYRFGANILGSIDERTLADFYEHIMHLIDRPQFDTAEKLSSALLMLTLTDRGDKVCTQQFCSAAFYTAHMKLQRIPTEQEYIDVALAT